VAELEPETARRNALLGWAFFGLFLVLLAASFAIALIYLAVVD
jgi:hypothetical protein